MRNKICHRSLGEEKARARGSSRLTSLDRVEDFIITQWAVSTDGKRRVSTVQTLVYRRSHALSHCIDVAGLTIMMGRETWTQSESARTKCFIAVLAGIDNNHQSTGSCNLKDLERVGEEGNMATGESQ